MLIMKRFKTVIFFSTAIIILFMVCNNLFADSVFLKNGNIVEGKILKENDVRIEIKTETGDSMSVLRKNVIRTLYHTKYKNKKVITKNDGVTIVAYIVDEDVESCTYRTELNSPDEIKISKDDIDSISRYKGVSNTFTFKNNDENISGNKRSLEVITKKELSSEEETRIRAPRIRIGLSMPGPVDENDNFSHHRGDDSDDDELSGVLIDLFLYRMRVENGGGLDFFLRLSGGWYNNDLGIYNGSYYNHDDYDIYQSGYGLGIRYINDGWYVAGMLWQFYLLGYYQYSEIDIDRSFSTNSPSYKYIESHDSKSSNGIVGGAGLEIGLFRYLGLFGEYTYGYSKFTYLGKDENIEGGRFRFGLTWRTSFL